MEITVAKHSGFCMGVQKAVETALSCSGSDVYILGELIHNPTINTQLKNKGLKKIDKIEDIKDIEKGTIIIRSHGVAKNIYEKIKEKGLKIIDTTCTFVKNVQKKAEKYYNDGYQIVILGDKNHPEVQGINGWCEKSAIIYDNEEKPLDLREQKKVCILCQTTFSAKKYENIIKNIITDNDKIVEIFNTICYTTIERQKEAAKLAKQNDCIIVIGGKSSSNTKKLDSICRKYNQNVIFIEYPQELDIENIKKFKKVAIVAGASTPKELIKEVYCRMEQTVNANINGDSAEKVETIVSEAEKTEEKAEKVQKEVQVEAKAEEAVKEKVEEIKEVKAEPETEKVSTMDQALKQMDLTNNKFRRGQTVKATIALASDEGLILAVGTRKSDVLMSKDNVEIDGNYDKTAYNVGDVIDVVVTKISPLELSRKQHLINLKDDELLEDLKQGKEFKVIVTGFNKGGLTSKFGTFNVFVPASLIRMRFVKPEDFEKYKDKELRLKLIEVKGKTIIASAKEIIIEDRKMRDEARQTAIKAFFESIEVGQVIEGKVVRFTNFGAFVNVNGFDCLAHISDLAWTNVKNAEDVLAKNETYEFVILKIDEEKQHVSIGYKQLQPKPWDLAEEKYPVDSTVKGKVVRLAPFGAFVEVEPGIDGLVHVSQITHDWIENPSSALKVGDEVEAKVVEVKPEAQKLTLSIKALQPVPETVVTNPNKKGDDEQRERKPRARKPRAPKKETEMREWSSSKSTGASIGDLLKDFNIELPEDKE